MKRVITVFLVCCGVTLLYLNSNTNRIYYDTEQEAVVSFYKNNISTLKRLTREQEMLGWVVKCKKGYYTTKPWVGGLSNPLHEPSTWLGCSVVANIHTHPQSDIGYNRDYYSKADLKSTEMWRMYLLSQDNCNVRVAIDKTNEYGRLLGKIKKCK